MANPRPTPLVSSTTLEELQYIGSCAISNAIERFRVRTRNEGFVNSSVRCMFPQFGPRVGYAVTARIRTSSTPVTGHCYFDRIDWWAYVNEMPAPRFLVVQDIDHMPGVGALFGEVHASIAKALGCVAYLTNGSVRDVPAVEASGFQLFAGGVSVSHAYAHIVEFGEPVEIGGLQIKPGDLLHGDQHGIVSIPPAIAADVPQMAHKMAESENELIEFCRSQDFSFDKLTTYIQRAASASGISDKDARY
jgi:4-hydroxy-4-methyl-2-oxoglutarate aldolase